MSGIHKPFLRSLDVMWWTGMARALHAALARKDAKAAAVQGLRILYWDMHDLLHAALAPPEQTPKALRSRFLKARADYAILAPLVRARKANLRLHRGILKGFQAMFREIPGANAFGVSKDWRKKVTATAGTILKLAAAALPGLHAREPAK